MQTTKSKIVEEKKTPKQKIREIIKKPKEKFLTKSQEDYWNVLEENQITLCFGPSGTGKSYIALKKAIDLLWEEDNKFEKIILVRPAVESDEKSIGSLPGTLNEKLEPYIAPSFHILKKICGKDSVDKLIEKGFIEIMSFNLMRGWSIDNTLVVVEETQNTTPKQMKLLLTRIGYNSKFLISGDIEQSDKFKDKTKSGLYDARIRLETLNNIGIFEFKEDDIVRNPIIGEILKRYND